MWMNDGAGTDTCVVVFDTADHADAAIVPLTPAGGPPIIGIGVHEVEVQARVPVVPTRLCIVPACRCSCW